MIPLTILTPVARARSPQNHRSLEGIQSLGLFDLALVEAFGYSEVARARNQVASLAYQPVKERGGLVLWLDADMVVDGPTVFLQAQLVMKLKKAISGRYIRRQDTSQIAAARSETEIRKPFVETVTLDKPATSVVVKGEPAMVGMGALMLPAEMFLEQADGSPKCYRTERGKPFTEYLVCCPRIIEHPAHGHVMLSEDFDYDLSLNGGTWLVEVTERGSGERTWLDYGHVGEQVLRHALKPHTLRDDRADPSDTERPPAPEGSETPMVTLD